MHWVVSPPRPSWPLLHPVPPIFRTCCTSMLLSVPRLWILLSSRQRVDCQTDSARPRRCADPGRLFAADLGDTCRATDGPAGSFNSGKNDVLALPTAGRPMVLSGRPGRSCTGIGYPVTHSLRPGDWQSAGPARRPEFYMTRRVPLAEVT